MLSGNFEKLLEKYYSKRKKVRNSILILPTEQEYQETPEQKKHRIFLENIEKYKKQEPFMMEQILNLRQINNFEEDLSYIQFNNGAKYLGGI